MTLRLLAGASCAALAITATPLNAAAAPPATSSATPATIVVTAPTTPAATDAPNTTATVDAGRIAATINAVNVEDTVKYLPSLVVRKRHVGDTQAPLATRTSGVGASARSLIYADGTLLSALIGNNNSTASPRWGLVSPQEVARIDVLYGPFSAAYPGNAIGAVVNITTRLPDRLEASVDAGVAVQRFDQYGTARTLTAYQIGATIGDRFGPLAVFASASQVTSDGQPLAYVTALRPAAPRAGGRVVTGAFDDVNRLGQPIALIGAGGFEHQRQDMLKLKLALDVAPHVTLTYVGGLFLNATRASAETYLGDAAGPAYAGDLNVGGYAITVPASSFANNVYRYDERHSSHSVSARGTGARLQWQVIATRYRFDEDVQRVPTTALPGALSGGAGNVTRLDGTGWTTFDANARWRAAEGSAHQIGGGYHFDRFVLASSRRATADWTDDGEGALNLASRGRTRAHAIWLQDAWTPVAPLTVTLGGRYEWWRASDGYNFALAPALAVTQPALSAGRFSPKAAVALTPAPRWRATLSAGRAFRFPTVTELYQAVTTGPSITVPNPALRPERATSAELAIEHVSAGGTIRLSAFSEVIDDALLSQTAPLLPGSATLFAYVQNVDRTRSRGIEVAVDRRDLVPGFDLAGSVTLVDAKIVADTAFAAAVGQRLPQVPRTKATIVATWRPVPAVSLTAAARYASRSFATIDNSDPVSHTYQGFDGYTVVDLRAVFAVAPRWSLGVGVDNVGNDRYFLFHPFPQRTFSVDVKWRL